MGVDGVSSTNTSSITPPLKPAEGGKSSSVSGDIWTTAKVAPKFEPKSAPAETKPAETSEVSVPYRPAEDTSSVVEARKAAHSSQVDDVAKLKAMAMAQYNEGRTSYFTGFQEVNNSQVESTEKKDYPVEVVEIALEESDSNSEGVPKQTSVPVEIVEVNPKSKSKRIDYYGDLVNALSESDVEKYSKFPETDDPTVQFAYKQIEFDMNRDKLTEKQKAAVRKVYSDVLNMQPGDTIVSRGNSYVNNNGDITVNGIKSAGINGDDNDIRAYADKAAVDLAWKLGNRNHQAKLDSLAREHTILRNKPNLTKEDSLQLDDLTKKAGDIFKRSAQYDYNVAAFRYNLKGFTE